MGNFETEETQMRIYFDMVEKKLEEILPQQTEFPPILFEAMRYSVLLGGKRIRPILMLASCEAVGGEAKKALPFACAIELIHTYSLIHDDLPAMDNDDFRRGNLTNHKVYGENMAILAGDGLLSYANEYMSEACIEDMCQETIKAMQIILRGAGIYGMLIGQVVDVCYEEKDIDLKTLHFIHEHKTASMIESSLEAGAVLGGADEEVSKQFARAGKKIGLAFQILDDILDVTSTIEVLGKPIGSDEKNHKTTYVTMFDMMKAKEIAKEYTEEAIAIFNTLESPSIQTGFLRMMTKYLMTRLY